MVIDQVQAKVESKLQFSQNSHWESERRWMSGVDSWEVGGWHMFVE